MQTDLPLGEVLFVALARGRHEVWGGQVMSGQLWMSSAADRLNAAGSRRHPRLNPHAPPDALCDNPNRSPRQQDVGVLLPHNCVRGNRQMKNRGYAVDTEALEIRRHFEQLQEHHSIYVIARSHSQFHKLNRVIRIFTHK